MVCAYCGAKLRVTNSRAQKRTNQVWRRKQCQRCLAVFTTHEAIHSPQAFRIARGGQLEDYMPDKLFTDVLLALQDRKNPYQDARHLALTITSQLMKLPSNPVFDTHEISSVAASVLKRFNKRAWMRFAAEHPSVTL